MLSLAIHDTTARSASDHPPPTAWRTRGQKWMPACEHCEAVSRKPLLRASTEENTLEKAAGSGADGPSRKALVTEKSHASGRPLGPLEPKHRPGDARKKRGPVDQGREGDHNPVGRGESGGQVFPR